jgi:hypothetical protein
LREALARGDHDFTLSEPRRGAKSRHTNRPRRLRRFLHFIYRAADYPNRIAGTLLVGLVIAICVNALLLQQGHHPAPLFHKSVALSVSAPQPIPRAGAMASMAPAETVRDPISQLLQSSPAVSEPEKADLPQRSVRDPISQFLKSEATQPSPQPSKTVFAAQRALVKLGFVLKPDGIVGNATRQAIEQFEHDHGLPAHGELSPRILRELVAQSGISIE